MRLALLVSILLASAGCADGPFTDASSQTGFVTVENASAVPVAVVAVSLSDAPLVDPMPALTADAFARLALAPGEQATLASVGRDDGVFAFVYAEGPLSERAEAVAGPDGKPQVASLQVSLSDLAAADFVVRVADL